MGTTPVPEYKQTRAWTRLRESWVGEFVRGCRGCRRELLAWSRSQRVALPDVDELSRAIQAFQIPAAVIAQEQDAETPVFLLSTGWRAGSTLLQRILITDPRLLLWGEPLGEMVLLSRIAEMVGRFISPRNLQLWRTQQDTRSPALATSWIANLYPASEDFRLALRSLFDRWLSEPARRRGFSRWGFKEVRFGATEASLLHWLYPNAKFVIISRHPYDAYRSLADSGWGQVYYSYPDVLADSATDFARHWNRLAVSWSQLPADFPSVHIKYEELIGGRVDFRSLESWLGLEIREDVALKASVGGTSERPSPSWYERWMISREAVDGMRLLGYAK